MHRLYAARFKGVNAMTAEAAEAFEGPDLLRFDAAEEVAVAGLRPHAEEGFAGGIPAILNLRDGEKSVAKLQESRRFVGLVSGVTEYLYRLHPSVPAPTKSANRISSASAFQAAPRKTMSAEI